MGLTINKELNTFEKDGKHFFYLADTCWSAFTNITDDDWDYYLDYRKNQGFNVLQINILPQWDASATGLKYSPYAKHEDGSFDFNSLNQEYFNHAAGMCKKAKDQGFELALVVLWCNYVPDTWASNAISNNIMPFDAIDTYVRKVNETFTKFDPIYIISGDTDFNTDKTIQHYKKASDMLHELSPKQLQTFHIKGRFTDLPKVLEEQSDFIMFQSGHNGKPENMNMPITLAKHFYEKVDKPSLNSEPCYEQMGNSGQVYGRFYEFDIRRAAWMSLLSGAYSGVTYGAAGIYSWHSFGKSFASELGEGFDQPSPWNEAIHFPGAWDYGFIRHIFESYKLDKLIPNKDVIEFKNEQICCAATTNEDKIFIYLPINTQLYVNKDVSDYDIKMYDLEDGRVGYTKIVEKNGKQLLETHRFKRDVLIVLNKRK
ncbi:apiosidase-like domain-containing protein [Breznakia pachnodae]|uniref:Apiosidase-like catalytic domain-containing protein n=1 Tax=Breznakia pachnodae TaxID=265178 RepID=A0ABU0DZW4_9FIRM|nr:DUF4038 domain-containing protein [Breznakia pachnodae]MDQ0360183.1 hypothetical protein [Breznakia pachnodae]